jgi:predicted dehydrogenase
MTDGRQLHVGFVGCGSHATHNLYPMLRYARCRLVGVCDLDAKLAERNASLHGAEAWYTDVDTMLDRHDLEAIFIVGPPEVHHMIGRECLARGIPIFVEKPPAPSLAAARELAAVARANKTTMMPGFVKRYALTYRKVAELLNSGEFVPVSAWMKFSHWQVESLEAMMLLYSIHTLDLLLALFGTLKSVGSRVTERPDGRLAVALTMEFNSGLIAQVALDSSQPRIQERLEISGIWEGENALLVVDNVQHIELHTGKDSGVDLAAPGLDTIEPECRLENIQVWRPDFGIPNMGQARHFFQGFAGEVREFVNAALARRQPVPNADDALRAMECVDAIVDTPNGTTSFATS